MNTPPISILHIEDSPEEVERIDDFLQTARYLNTDLVHTQRLETGLQYIAARRFDLVLLDLSLPDCAGLEAYLRVRTQSANLPVIVMIERDDKTGPAAMQAGAADYLVKSQITGGLLIRAIRYAVERNRVQAILNSQSWTDDLTGLYNRRGFMELAGRHIKLMQRLQKGLLLFFADLDGLQGINERFGHQAGDEALRAVAQSLQHTFRGTDILARVGDDEFAVLMLGTQVEHIGLLKQRLQVNVDQHNARTAPTRRISVSLAGMEYSAASHVTADNWLAEIESLMTQRRESALKSQ